MKNTIFIIVIFLFFGLTSCTRTIQLVCTDPNTEIFIGGVNYGTGNIPIIVPRNNIPKLEVECHNQQGEIHTQSIYITKGKKTYDIEMPTNLYYSTNPKY
jgi:hypothetical protein